MDAERAYAAKLVVEQERDALATEAYIENLRVQAEYRATYVTRLDEEIAKNETQKENAMGTDDEDLYTKVADTVNAWYRERLVEQSDMAKATKELYDEQKLQFEKRQEA